jgi:GT2 family glycosyltransferase
MLISVIIPTCNRNELLQKCLDSLSPGVQTTLPAEYEVIVTDDSKDNSAKGLIETKFKWAKWVGGPKKGPAANRNNGAKYAKGNWLIFIDDDCLPDSNILSQYISFSRKNPFADVMEGLIYSDPKMPLLYAAPTNTTGGYLWSCNFAIKRDVFKKVDGFDENYKYPNLEDNDIHKRLKQLAFNIEFVEEAKVYHPPRRIASPKKFAQYHESWFYYHAKFGHPKSIYNLLFSISRYRLREIWDAPKNINSIRAFKFLLQELFFSWYKYKNKKKVY